MLLIRKFNITLLLAFCCQLISANDTVYLRKPINALTIGYDNGKEYYCKGKHFQISDLAPDSFFEYLKFETRPKEFFFDSCSFSKLPEFGDMHFSPESKGTIYIQNSRVNYLPMRLVNTNVNFYKSYLDDLFITPGENTELTFTKCYMANDLELDDCSPLLITFDNNETKNYYKASIKKSNIWFSYSSEFTNNHLQFRFESDTIHAANFQASSSEREIALRKSGGAQPAPIVSSINRKFEFINCYIEGAIDGAARVKGARAIFIKCTFGPEADLSQLPFDQVEFVNCRNLTDKINVGFLNESEPCKLRIVNSDFNNIDIIWNNSLKLDFDSTDQPDIIKNTFENLLSKYKQESKEDSYQIVDLQYKSRMQGSLFHFIDRLWWNHGYGKYRVFLWTAVLLTIFMIFNFLFWNGIHATYTIVEYDCAQSNKHKVFLVKSKAVLLYTVFIFFSLRVDFEKLKTSSPLSYITWFFFQYLTGIFCLLFIVKAVIQL